MKARFDGFEWEQQKYLQAQLQHLPVRLHESALNKHARISEAKGYREGNIWIRESINKIKERKIGLIQSVDLDADAEDFEEAAKRKAGKYADLFNVLNSKIIEHAEQIEGIEIPGKTFDAQLKRLCDPKFWIRRIRKELRQHREVTHLLMAPERIKYVSRDGHIEYLKMLDGHKAWAINTAYVSDTGEVIPAPTPEASAKRRYAQLLAQTKGLSQVAEERHLKAIFVTLTLDSNWHASRQAGRARIANDSYDESTPREAHQYFTEQWARFRALMKKRNIDFEYVNAVHAHKNSTPHRHLILWTLPEHKNEVIEMIYTYFKTNDFDEQIVIEEPRQDGSAVAYASRILAYMTRHMGEDATNEDIKEAEAVSAWGSTWSIRRYSTSLTKSTLWKIARNKGVEGVPKELAEAAQEGRYKDFIELCDKYQAKIKYEAKENSYGEEYKIPCGMTTSKGEAKKVITWTRISIKKVTVILKSQEVGEITEIDVTDFPEILQVKEKEQETNPKFSP